MPPPQKDPARFFKQALKDHLLYSVYDLWERRLAARMDDLIIDNARMIGDPLPYLRLRGKCWALSTALHPGNDYYPSNKLHPSLKDTAHAWVEDFNEIDTEKRITGYSLGSVLSVSDHLDDYAAILPEGLQSQLQDFPGAIPDQTLAKRAPSCVIDAMKASQAPHLALLGQRFVRSLIL